MIMKVWRGDHAEYVTVRLTVAKYINTDRLAIYITEASGEPYGMLTVNLPEYQLYITADEAFVDVNNIPFAEDFIKSNKIGESVGVTVRSGFCKYPLYRFNRYVLEEEE